jgi:hypothetical protein
MVSYRSMLILVVVPVQRRGPRIISCGGRQGVLNTRSCHCRLCFIRALPILVEGTELLNLVCVLFIKDAGLVLLLDEGNSTA